MSTQFEIARRAHEMLMRAMELESPLRRDFAREACAGDPILMKRLFDLLDAVDRSEKFLDTPALVRKPVEEQSVPDAVGNYLVIGVLGVGGMATVYEAIQEHPKRHVALKVMHQSMTNSGAYVRFQFETETLARLHHPGIAQIYEAGAARLGQPAPAPFFAMELIPDATPISVYADRHTLLPRERVAMLASVCDAVHHGHQHGIIHRDLKPANVLVDSEGRAKVIDFGVARTIEASESLTRASDVRQLIGTLNYMSPEQCSTSADIDIRTDIYSLGVMLYELAYGHLPHDLGGLPIPVALQTIVHEPPRRPETSGRRVDRDLEAIILKAIDMDPDRRYESAAALATDLRRWLNDEATQARPPGVIDLFRLFARRHRGLVVAALSVAVSLILIAAISTGFAVRLAKEVALRRSAEQQSIRERDRARWEAYIAQIAGALSAIKTGEFLQMRTSLAAASYQPRGWEWGYLSRLSERSASTILAHDSMIMDLAVNSDWTRFATAASDGVVRLWDANTESLLATFDESDSGARAYSVAFSADGQRIVTGDVEGVVRLLDSRDLGNSEVLTKMPGAVRTTVALPDGRIAVAAADGSAQIWALQPRAALNLPADQPGGIRGIEASSDGSMLATFNDTGSVWVRNTRDLTVSHRFQFPGSVAQVRFSNDGRYLAAAGASGRLLIWSVVDGTVFRDLQAAQGVNTVRSLAFSTDGSLIAAGLVHRGIMVISVADSRVVGELGGHSEAVSALRFRPDDQLLVSASWDRTIRTWRTSEFESPGGTISLEGHRKFVRAVSFSPDGSIVASASHDGSIRLWDPDLALPVARFTAGNAAINALDFSSDGEQIAAGFSDRRVRIFQTSTGRILTELNGHNRSVATVAFDPSGDRLASGGDDQTVRVWDRQTGTELRVLRGHRARVNSVRFSPNGALIASGSRDGTVRLWDAQTGEERSCLTGHTSDVFAVLFSHDGRQLFSGSRDQSVRVWDVEAGTPVATLEGHGQYVTCLALNPDGTRLAAGSWFGKIVLFDVAKFDLIASFRGHESAIRGIAFSPDGRWLASCSYDNTVRLFDSATRLDSDSARKRAQTAQGAAERVVRSLLGSEDLTPDVALKRLAEAGIDPERDPWIRKCLLSAVAPPEENPEIARPIRDFPN